MMQPTRLPVFINLYFSHLASTERASLQFVQFEEERSLVLPKRLESQSSTGATNDSIKQGECIKYTPDGNKNHDTYNARMHVA
jgi:hypothetical protein